MTVTDFKSLKKDIYKNRHLDKDYFAESVTYKPISGAASRTIVMQITDEQGTDDEDETQREVERVSALCLRDEDDADKGGVQAPIRGDRILRSATIDPSQRHYVFAGEVRGRTDDKHRLIFERPKTTAHGTNQ